ncbi:MAG: PAS domain S-box protein [Cytophagales bacterium]|nr:MAG: PAS domain S-box protein [Cytophagales bacterium]
MLNKFLTTRIKINLMVLLFMTIILLVVYFISNSIFNNIINTFKIPSDNAGNLIANIDSIYWGIIIISLSISIYGIYYFLKQFLSPINYLNECLSLIEQGILPKEISIDSQDEIGEMSKKLNNITSNLRNTAQYAYQIGEGKFDEDFKALSKEDVLGHSLLNMSNALQEADQREIERNWIINGVADLGEILRNNNSLTELSNDVIKYMITRINAVQGAFFVVNEGDEEQRTSIEAIALYAYNRKKFVTKKFFLGEGLIGQAAAEQYTILRTEIPKGYESISSGILGDKKPTCILISPLINNEKVYGVVEFAGFEKFTPNQIKFIEEVSPIIARTIFNIQVNLQTQLHLEQSQKMSSELRQQQEELRQNAEEMQATQEELKMSNQKLEEQIKEVSNTQKRMHSLLENASEVITIYEKDGKIKYVSPSVNRILGYNAEELIGTKEDKHLHEENLSEFQDTIRKLIVHPSQTFNLQFQYLKRNGDWIWLEATGKNLLDDPAVKGIVFNARDITLKRKAEIEERMRKNMQALSENSPDLITRISSEGIIAYTNPSIEVYTGNKPNAFINESLSDLKIGNGIIATWQKILDEIKVNSTKIKMEAGYHSPIGERIMQINAIPEFNEEELESVLVVSHDITERKRIELEIQAKNKNINESINYSKRIQNAIIPDTKLIQTIFPESFILYKPRDVVSGDFPWFIQKDDTSYIAAVDCTGHGVPGAMLSLVGYFQLNNIVDAMPDENPAIILDQLDQRVNNTLIKENSEEAIKDGMDIAFCKINHKSKIVEFAGAHRQLLHLSNGQITEYKGDKWAIGGGIYKNQTHFTNHQIKVKKGDAIFFFSDGFPDQFGGAENRKFTANKIKNIILENSNNPIEKIHVTLLSEFEQWKGDNKQTDDVLLIGIKF